MEFCSNEIKQNHIIQAHFQHYCRISMGLHVNYHENLIGQDYFWRRVMDHYIDKNSNFSLQNIEFYVEKLFGLAKYPINIWNLLELTSNDLKYNLNNQKLKLNLFLKSAMSILNATMMNSVT